MAERRTFLLVFFESHEGVAGGSATASPPLPSLGEVLGLEPGELAAVRYRGLPLFASDRLGADELDEPQRADDYLTIVSLRTILHERDPDLAVLAVTGSELLDPRFSLPSGFAEQLAGIGLSTTFAFTAEGVARVARRIRELFPGSPLLVGGAGITLNPDWFEATGADLAVLGDAEAALPRLLERLTSGAPSLESIPNLLYRAADGAIARTPRLQFPIDRIPTPRWDLARGGAWPRMIWYESERGCPFRCTFCSYPNQALEWSLKSPERMLEEFMLYAERGVTSIGCFDSTMVTPPKRMAAFCALLAERRLPLRWHCYAHAANLQDPALTRAMHDAGCRSVSIGLESVDETVLRMMRKHVSPDRLQRAIANCTAAGLLCAVNVIIGFPGETHETFQRTVDGLARLEPDAIGIQPFQVRDRTIPILRMENANLVVGEGSRPYWKHDGMDLPEASRLSLRAMWEVALRSERTIVPPVAAAARAPMTTLDDREANLFRRRWIHPVVNAYGRYLCFAPELEHLDRFYGRPMTIPLRSEDEAARQLDRARSKWHAMVAAAESAESGTVHLTPIPAIGVRCTVPD